MPNRDRYLYLYILGREVAFEIWIGSGSNMFKLSSGCEGRSCIRVLTEGQKVKKKKKKKKGHEGYIWIPRGNGFIC